MQDKQFHKYKKIKSNREQDTIKRKHKKIRSEVRATALRPRLHHCEGFHYPQKNLPQKDLTIRNYNHLEYTTPQLNLLH